MLTKNQPYSDGNQGSIEVLKKDTFFIHQFLLFLLNG